MENHIPTTPILAINPKMESHKGKKSSNQDGLKQPQVAVVMVPFPAQGHLNQLLHLSHSIASYGLPVHYVGSTTHNRQAKVRLHGWHPEDESTGDKVRFQNFELPPYDSLPPIPNPSMHFPLHLFPIWEAAMYLRQPVFQLLQQLSATFSRVVVIYDILMASVVQDVKLISNAEAYTFVPVSAFSFLTLQDISNPKNLPSELDPDDISECSIVTEWSLPPEMEAFLGHQQQFTGIESGLIFNTSRAIEGRFFNMLEKLSDKKCFAVGPFNPVEIAKGGEKRHVCLEWLDKKEKDSVIYVSFGTMTAIIDEQIQELALGLERSGAKFIWALRDADKSDVFSGTTRRMQLPEGYEDRVKNRGLIVREWAPQLEILAHSSVGGFMSHCGWNSCLESISMGVAMATWPMHSDQPRNAVLMTEVLKIGTVVRHWAGHGELVSSTTIENAVRRLMESEEGEAIRKRAAELGDAVRGSVVAGGSSRLEMDGIIGHFTR